MPKIDKDGREYIEQDGKTYHKDFFGEWQADTDWLGNEKVERTVFGNPKIKRDFFGDQVIERDFWGQPLVEPDRRPRDIWGNPVDEPAQDEKGAAQPTGEELRRYAAYAPDSHPDRPIRPLHAVLLSAGAAGLAWLLASQVLG